MIKFTLRKKLKNWRLN